MASSNINWICGQCTHKNEGSSEHGPCHLCQTPHRKRKAVSVPTSALPAKSACIFQPARSRCGAGCGIRVTNKAVCIGQPARSSGSVINLSTSGVAQTVASAASLAKAVSIDQPAPCSSGSVIDLSAPDAALAVASASPAKPVYFRQPAPCSSGSIIDLSAPDAALALASVSPAKPVFGLFSSNVIDIVGIDAVKENRVLADNHVLAIVVGQLKSREQEAAYRCRALEELLDWEQPDNRRQ